MMIERGNPLSGATQRPRQVQEKRPVPRRSKHVLFMKKLWNMIERGHPLWVVTQITSQESPKHVHLMTARASTLKIKQHMIKVRHPLSAVTQVTRQEPPKHVPLMKAQTSTLETKQILIARETRCRPWRKSRARWRATNAERGEHWFPNTWSATFCCETSWELLCSRIGQEDQEPPSPTCSSTRFTTKQSLQPVQYDDKANDSGRGQRGAVWIARDGLQKRSAKHAYHTGVQASSIAHAGISWKKLLPIEVSLNFQWTFFQFQNT